MAAVVVALLLAGCSPDPNDGDELHLQPEPEVNEVHAVPLPRDLEGPVARAVADLAGRLDLAPAGITVREARRTTWPDGAIGCPEPDMYYTQALVPGYRIVLEADGQTWRYHGARDRDPFHCPEDRAREPLKGETAGER